jgi:acyl-coenzyme A thioesterase PaaI-like protein
MSDETSLQDRYAPNLTCFGCGPKNDKGLQIKSFVAGDVVVATFHPQPHFLAYDGMMNGGIIGVLLDCHMNWTAAWHLMRLNELEVPPCTVTAHFGVTFKLPTPMEKTLQLKAWVVEASPRKAKINATLGYDGVVTAEGEGTFVAVKEGHPAYHRW